MVTSNSYRSGWDMGSEVLIITEFLLKEGVGDEWLRQLDPQLYIIFVLLLY